MARPIKPTHLKLVTGTARKHRLNKAEPQPSRERPSPPAHLSERGKAAWHEATLLVDRMGVLTEADPLALEALAEAIADLRGARASLARPLTLKGNDGEEQTLADGGERYYWTFGKGGPMRRARPEITDIADADRRIAMWFQRFGLTPADRSRVSAADKNEAVSPWDELGAGGKKTA